MSNKILKMPNKNLKTNGDIIVGLDIGTSKVVCLVGRYSISGDLEIIALGTYPSSGLKKGVVVNIDATTDAIEKAVEQAQTFIEEKIKNVYVGIAGSHVKSLNSEGVVGINSTKEVSHADVEAVIESIKAVAVPSDQTMLHVIDQEYIIDKTQCMNLSEQLEFDWLKLLVTCASNAISNIEKCILLRSTCKCICTWQLASSWSILTEDEKDLGVCLIDIGGGTTDIAILRSGSIVFTGVIPIAGDQVTSDIAVALRTPTNQAEEIKQKYGCAVAEFTSDEEMIEVMGVGGRPPRELSRRTLADIIEPRYV